MRILGWVFTVLGVLGIGVWALFYTFISAMACAYGSVNGNCRTKAPWELGPEDLMILVLMPMTIIVVLFGLGWFCRRTARRSASDRAS